MSSFIAGGVLGMIGAMYLMQQKPQAMQSVNKAMTGVRSNVMNKVVSSMTSKAAKSRGVSAQKPATGSVESSEKNHKENEALIKNIIASDPSLKNQFENITNHSTSTASTVKH